ncbi:MAG: hypothetical protein Q7J29_07615 [Stagnimonas sp.]|nr:hypothetical protein [Stagnimonas sp.]
MASERAFSKWFRLSLVFACGWLFVAALLLVQFWPSIPQTKAQWALFVAFGPPFYFLAEFVAEKIFPAKHGSRITPEGFSFKRVLVALPLALVFLVVVFGLAWLLTRY